MTALSACVALFPLLIDASSPGKEILHPVAVTIFGGLISATILDAVLTPVLFLKFGRKPLERLRASALVVPIPAGVVASPSTVTTY
jgi:HME family heavy-metal exporter